MLSMVWTPQGSIFRVDTLHEKRLPTNYGGDIDNGGLTDPRITVVKVRRGPNTALLQLAVGTV